MANLSTNYLGLKLKNPLIVSSSGLTNSVDKIIKLESAGAGAVVLKSLFEEQINYEAGSLMQNNDYPEAEDYIRNYTKSNNLDAYLNVIEEAKKKVEIPVIASINCVSSNNWVDFAKRIENAGADAIELNVFIVPTEEKNPAEYEKMYIDIAQKILSVTSLPVAMKLGRNFTNLMYTVQQLYSVGIKAVVLFNRFYEPDIDIDQLKIVSSDVFSQPGDLRYSLRWTGMISDHLKKIEISASTGIHDAKAVIKQILAGAQTTQLCSVLYKKGPDYLLEVLAELEKWMDDHGFKSVDDFRAKMNYKNIKEPGLWERAQFMKYFSNME